MEADYGPVHFTAVDLVRFSRRNVYTPDQSDLLYVNQILGFTATYTPGGFPVMPSAVQISPDTVGVLDGTDDTATVLTALTPRGRNPGAGRGILPIPALEPAGFVADPLDFHAGPETDAELRNRLMVPRQKLILWAFDRQTGQKIRWLESPRPGFAQDATTGPLPIACDVVSVSGEPNSVGVYFQISTDTTPCPIGSDRLVLSHRWQMTHEPDDDFYLTRKIEGTIVFHGGVLQVLNARPDLIAAQFIHPIPLGFRRKPPVLTESPDGLTIRYTVWDTDPEIIFSPGDSAASQIEIIERHTLTTPKLGFNKSEGVPDGWFSFGGIR